MRGDSWFAGFRQLIYDRRNITNPASPAGFFSESRSAYLDSFVTRQTQSGNEGIREGINIKDQIQKEVFSKGARPSFKLGDTSFSILGQSPYLCGA